MNNWKETLLKWTFRTLMGGLGIGFLKSVGCFDSPKQIQRVDPSTVKLESLGQLRTFTDQYGFYLNVGDYKTKLYYHFLDKEIDGTLDSICVTDGWTRYKLGRSSIDFPGWEKVYDEFKKNHFGD